jgi:hypothetical protein
MSTSSAVIKNLARHLIATEASGNSCNGPAVPAFCVCEKLRAPLTKLAGDQGYSSLLSRALVLATRQVPSLAAVRVDSDGSLTGLEAIELEGDKREETGPWGDVLVAELLNLLVTFIGESLTLILVRQVWPQVVTENLTLRCEEKP